MADSRDRPLAKSIGRIVLFGIGLGILYYVVDVFVDVYVFGNRPLEEQLLNPDTYEIYERGFVTLLITAFAAFVEFSTLRIRRTRNVLQARERQMRGLAAAMGDGVYMLDHEGRLLFLNPAAEQMLGWKEEEVQGKDIHGIVHYQHLDGSPYPLEECGNLQVFRTLKPYRTEDEAYTRKDGSIFPASVVSTPLMEKDRVIASVTVFQDISDRKKAEAMTDALDRINGLIHSTLNFEEIMQKVKVEAARAIGSDASVITLREGDHWVMEYIWGLPERYTGRVIAGEEARYLAIIAHNREVLVIDNARTDPRISSDLAKVLGIRSLVCAPLVVRDQVMGVIALANKHDTVYSQPQVDFAVKVADSVSLAIENTRLYDDERQVAHTLQEAILTLPEDVPGVEIGHIYRSATETAEVGGDFYDLFELEHDRVAVTIGDVSGKGLEAAALTSLIKHAIKAYAHDYDSPAKVMEKTNRLVTDATAENVFATLFFAILDTTNGRLRWCRAGHPPPVLVGRERCDVFTEGSPPVGAFRDMRFTEHECILQERDKLVLYTDGVTEAREDDSFFGEQQLVGTACDLRDQSAGEIPQMIFEKVAEFSGGRLADDMAVLVLGYTPR